MAPREDVPRDVTQHSASRRRFEKKETCCPWSFMLAYRIATSLLQQRAERYRSRRGEMRPRVYVSRSSYSLENPAIEIRDWLALYLDSAPFDTNVTVFIIAIRKSRERLYVPLSISTLHKSRERSPLLIRMIGESRTGNASLFRVV